MLRVLLPSHHGILSSEDIVAPRQKDEPPIVVSFRREFLGKAASATITRRLLLSDWRKMRENIAQPQYSFVLMRSRAKMITAGRYVMRSDE